MKDDGICFLFENHPEFWTLLLCSIAVMVFPFPVSLSSICFTRILNSIAICCPYIVNTTNL